MTQKKDKPDKIPTYVSIIGGILGIVSVIIVIMSSIRSCSVERELKEERIKLAHERAEVAEKKLEYAERFMIPPEAREGIVITYKGVEKAIQNGDKDSLVSYFSDKLNKDKILGEWQGYLGKKVFFEVQTLAKGSQDGQIIATVKGEILGTRTSWYFQDTLIKEAGQWKFIE